MAIIDSGLIFYEDLKVTDEDDVTIIGDVIDLYSFKASGARGAIENGEPIYWVNFVTPGSSVGQLLSTSKFDIQLHSGPTESAVGTQNSYARTRRFVGPDDIPYAFWSCSLPVTNRLPDRYLGVAFDLIASPFTSIRLTSYLTVSPPPFGHGVIKDWRM